MGKAAEAKVNETEELLKSIFECITYDEAYIKKGCCDGSILRQLILEIIRLQNSTW